MINNGEFKGTTKEAIRGIHKDISDLQKLYRGLDKRVWIILIILAGITVERLPIVQTVLANFK